MIRDRRQGGARTRPGQKACDSGGPPYGLIAPRWPCCKGKGAHSTKLQAVTLQSIHPETSAPGGRLCNTVSPGSPSPLAAEAAAYLGISYWTLRDLTFRGEVPHVKIGRRILVDRLDSRCVPRPGQNPSRA